MALLPVLLTCYHGKLGTFLGPTIRGARDIQHKLTGSKYQKEGGGIVGDVIKDYGLNAAGALAPTVFTEWLPGLVNKATGAKRRTFR